MDLLALLDGARCAGRRASVAGVWWWFARLPVKLGHVAGQGRGQLVQVR